ncbi:hypothetical protein J2Z79_002416 [Symbiobacterium terraclitae]|uniref:Uncharacterized protein n=1 Tax=Symbiobacterium terraclitae TaxID=557451 RepID=A0ABS4JU07_9FIRM|nr:hypothetical protein [Symbiobacterium terraclitae]MBP2019000.1 hypothetical protein [Symbiobacterium terraclitae]
MTRLMRSFLVFAACCFAGAFVVQTFFPDIGGQGTAWGLAPGWQREIGFWNVFAAAVTVGALTRGDGDTPRIVTLGIVVLALLLGTNHLVAVVGRPDGWAHYTPLIVNYLAVAWGSLALLSGRRIRATPRSTVRGTGS